MSIHKNFCLDVHYFTEIDLSQNPKLIVGRGGPCDDVIIGNDRNNVLLAGAGDDVVLGGAGDDLIFTGRGDDEVDPGLDDDFVVLNGRGEKTIAASEGDDVIVMGARRVDLTLAVDEATPIGRETVLGWNDARSDLTIQFDVADPNAFLESLAFVETRRGFAIETEDGGRIAVSGRQAKRLDSLDDLIVAGVLSFAIEADPDDEIVVGSNANDVIRATGDVLVDPGAGDDQIFAATKAGETLTIVNSVGRDVVEVSGDGTARGVTRVTLDADGSVVTEIEECLIWEFEAGEVDAATVVNEIEIITLGAPTEVDLQMQLDETDFDFAQRVFRVEAASGAEIELFGLGIAQGIDSTEALIERGFLTFRYASDVDGQTIRGSAANDVIETSGFDVTIDAGAGDDTILIEGSRFFVDGGEGRRSNQHSTRSDDARDRFWRQSTCRREQRRG